MSTIRDTINKTITDNGMGHYLGEPIVAACTEMLEEREAGIIEELQSAYGAMTHGDRIPNEVLVAVGLMQAPEPEPEPEGNWDDPEPETTGDKLDQILEGVREVGADLATLRQRVASLTEFARANGYVEPLV